MHRKLFLSLSFFYLSVGFWCWTRSSESQDSTSLRENDHTNFPLESPKNTVSPLNGNANNFSLKACGSFLSSSRANMYYFIAKSSAPSKSNNTREHFRAGSSTHWRHVLNGYNLTCSRLGSVGVPVRISFFQGFLQNIRFVTYLDTVSYIVKNSNDPDYLCLSIVVNKHKHVLIHKCSRIMNR